jgi:hypothetical protein
MIRWSLCTNVVRDSQTSDRASSGRIHRGEGSIDGSGRIKQLPHTRAGGASGDHGFVLSE